MKVFHFLYRRSIRYRLDFVAAVFIVFGIIVMIELISVRYNKRFDLTAKKMYTLSPQSKKVIKLLTNHVEITAFYKEGQPGKEKIADLLRQYAYESPHLKYVILDPDEYPARAQKYNITCYGSIAIESNGRSMVIEKPDEGRITNAIYNLTRGEKKYIYFLKGHDEKNITSDAPDGYKAIKQEMEKEGYVVEDLFLIDEELVPKDCSLLVISGPKKKILTREIEKISRFIYHKGKAIFMIDPYFDAGLSGFLSEHNILLQDGVIVDKASHVYGGDSFTVVASEYSPHAITRNLTIPSLFSLVRSVEPGKLSQEGIIVRSLVKTGPESWIETDKNELEKGEPTFQVGKDKKGPISIAAIIDLEFVVKEKNEEINGSFVIYGDSEFIDNSHINLGGNKDLFLNTVAWLGGEEDLISIRPRETESGSFVIITPAQAKLCFWLPLVAQPLLVLMIGIVVCILRRLRE